MRFDGQVAVITGASSGIGAALARQLGAAGARLGLIALPGGDLETVAEGIRTQGGTAITAAADVADKAALTAALDRIAEELGPIDLLILNAGIGLNTTAMSFSTDNFETLIRVNLLGVAYGIEAVLPRMIQRGKGHIVGVSSLSSYRGVPFVSGYTATKAAVATLLEGLRVELKVLKIDVTVTTVRPGFVATPMTDWVRRRNVLMEVEPAAKIILKGIARRRAEIKFPRSGVFFTNLLRILPCTVHDWVICRLLARLKPTEGRGAAGETSSMKAPASETAHER